MEKKKKSDAGFRILTAAAIVALLMILSFCISYCSVSEWYARHLDTKEEAKRKSKKATAQVLAEESLENCTITMLYLDNPDTEEVDYCALKVFNRLNREMGIFMIPTSSMLHMKNDLNQELSEKAGKEVPKELFLKSVGSYYTDLDTKYVMTTKVMQELIGGVEIDSYEALDYESMIKVVDLAAPVKFKTDQMVTFLDENNEVQKLVPGTEHEIDGRKALGILTYSDGFGAGDGGRIERSSSYFTEYALSITEHYSKQQMSEYLSGYQGLIKTNGKIDDANSYLEDCLKLNEENLSFYTLKGTQKEQVYILDPDKIQDDIKILMGEDAFKLATTEKKEETMTASGEPTQAEAPESSKDKQIVISNGAYINGLAGRWKERLEQDGYTIASINDYSGGTRDNAKFIVSKEGYGEDLKAAYFPDAEIEVGIPDNEADIQIILGRAEDF